MVFVNIGKESIKPRIRDADTGTLECRRQLAFIKTAIVVLVNCGEKRPELFLGLLAELAKLLRAWSAFPALPTCARRKGIRTVKGDLAILIYIGRVEDVLYQVVRMLERCGGIV